MQTLTSPQSSSPVRSPNPQWPFPPRSSTTPRRPSVAVVDALMGGDGPPTQRRASVRSPPSDDEFYSEPGTSRIGLIQQIADGQIAAGDAGPEDEANMSTSDWDDAAAPVCIPSEPHMPRSYLLASGPLRHQSTSLDKGARDWNEEFQSLWEVECRPPWSVEGRKKLERLLKEFDTNAKRLTSAIMSAGSDTEAQHSSPSPGRSSVSVNVRAAMSGSSRAGMESSTAIHAVSRVRRGGLRALPHFPGCYRQGNLLIRRWRNGDIGKAVQRTFRSMFEARVPQLFFPLTSTHSYMGVVVTVQALLPLEDSAAPTPRSTTQSSPARSAPLHSSIVYRGDAVADASQTRPAHHYTVRLLEALNLSPHDCGNQWKQMGLELVEGLDGRYYATNAVGLLPPLFPSHVSPTAHFRFEHLIQYAEPAHYMSSATIERFREPITDLIMALPELVNDRGDRTAETTLLFHGPPIAPSGRNKRHQRLIEMLHERSINVALLGRVLTQWLGFSAQSADLAEDAETLDNVTTCICVEMIARTIKSVISVKASQDTDMPVVDTECANSYLARAVASMVRRQQTTSGHGLSAEILANSRFEDSLLPALTEKFDVSGMEEMDQVRRAFDTQHVAITKRLCDLLGLTMHRGVVVAIACVPHNHNFSPMLSVGSELRFSRWLMNEALDADCPQEVLVSFVLPRRAAIHCRSGAYDKALSLQRRITSRRLRLGARNFLYFDSLIDTALVAAKSGEEEAADTLYQRVLDGYETMAHQGSVRWSDGGCRTHLSRLKILLQLYWGNLKVGEQRFREARKRYTDALEMTRRLHTDAIPASMMLSCFNGLIEIAAKSPSTEDVLALQSHLVLAVMRMRPSPRGLETLRSLSTVLFEGRHHQAAAETLRDAMELCSAVHGSMSEEMAIVTNYLSFVYYRWNVRRYGSTCRELLSTCQRIMREVRGATSAGYMTATNNLIRLQVELGEYTRASVQLHRLLRQPTSIKAVPGLSRQHPVYHALLETREFLSEHYREKAVVVLQRAWRGFQEKLILQDIVQQGAVLIQMCGRGLMTRRRLNVVRCFGTPANLTFSVSHKNFNAPSPMSQRNAPTPARGATTPVSTPQESFRRGISPSTSVRGTAHANQTLIRMRDVASREDNPFIFGFSRHLLTTSVDVDKDCRDWNAEYQAMIDVSKSSFDPSATQRYERRAQNVRDAFRAAIDRFVRVIEETPSRAPKAPGSSTAFRFDNVVITRWPPDAVTPFAQEEAMRRVIAAGFPGITAPLLETIETSGGTTYVAQALIPLPRANVEYLRHEDLRPLVLSRKGALHHAFLEVLVDQVTATEPPHPSLSAGGGLLPTSAFNFFEDEGDNGGDDGMQFASASLLASDGYPKASAKGIEVLRGMDDRWYVTNALGLLPTCIWTMETFDNTAKSRAGIRPLLPMARQSVLEACRALISRGRVDEALTMAEEWVVSSQRHLKEVCAAEGRRSAESMLGSILKAFVLGATGRPKDAYQQLRTVALSLEQREACTVRASEAWLAGGRMLLAHGQEFLDSAAMLSRALQLLIKSPSHRFRTLTLLQCLESLIKAHLANHDKGNAPLPPVEETTVPIDTILRWVALAAQTSAPKKYSGSTPPPMISYEVCRRASRYYETRNMWDEAITFSTEARRLCVAIFGECSTNHAQDLDRSAVLHHQRSDSKKDDIQRSLELLQSSIDVMKRAAPDSLELGILHNRMGAIQVKKFALSSAAFHLRQAHTMLSMRLHHDHRELVSWRSNTKLLELKLNMRAAVRIQSYVRGWLFRHRAEEALRYSDPPAFRRVVVAKYEKRFAALLNLEIAIRLDIVDSESTSFFALEKEELRFRERARRSGVRHATWSIYDALMSERGVCLCRDIVVPQEALLRSGREWFATIYLAPLCRTFFLDAHRMLVRQHIRAHHATLQLLKRTEIEAFEQIRRRSIETRGTMWILKIVEWHEGHVRHWIKAKALSTKQLIGEDFAEGANMLLGYTQRIQSAVQLLQQMRSLESEGEPAARLDVIQAEGVEREKLCRLMDDVLAGLNTEDNANSFLDYPIDATQQLDAASTSSTLTRGAEEQRHTSCSSEWSHGGIPQLYVTSPARSSAQLSAKHNEEGSATEETLEMDSAPCTHREEAVAQPVLKDSFTRPAILPLAQSRDIGLDRSPIDHSLVSHRGRRTPRGSVQRSSSLDLSVHTDIFSGSGVGVPELEEETSTTTEPPVPSPPVHGGAPEFVARETRRRPSLTLDISRPSPLPNPLMAAAPVESAAEEGGTLMERRRSTPFLLAESKQELSASGVSSRSPLNQSGHTAAHPGSAGSGYLEPSSVVGSGTFPALGRSPPDVALRRSSNASGSDAGRSSSRRTSTQPASSVGADSRRQSGASSLVVHQDSDTHRGTSVGGHHSIIRTPQETEDHLSPLHEDPPALHYKLPDDPEDDVSRSRSVVQPRSSKRAPSGGGGSAVLQSVRPVLSAKNLAKLHKSLSDSNSHTIVPPLLSAPSSPDESSTPLGPVVLRPTQEDGGSSAASSSSENTSMSLAPEEGGPALTPVRKNPQDDTADRCFAHYALDLVLGEQPHETNRSGVHLRDDGSDVFQLSVASSAPPDLLLRAAAAVELSHQEVEQRRNTLQHEEHVRNATTDYMCISYEALLKAQLLASHAPDSEVPATTSHTKPHRTEKSKPRSASVSSVQPLPPTRPLVRKHSGGARPAPTSAAVAAPSAPRTISQPTKKLKRAGKVHRSSNDLKAMSDAETSAREQIAQLEDVARRSLEMLHTSRTLRTASTGSFVSSDGRPPRRPSSTKKKRGSLDTKDANTSMLPAVGTSMRDQLRSVDALLRHGSSSSMGSGRGTVK